MANTYGFNWSWVGTADSTLGASGVVRQAGGTIYTFRQASGGGVSSSDLTSFSRSVGQNLQSFRSDWRNYTRPVLNSLPAGNADSRWSTTAGQGLPAKIDAFTYGLQGCTLFVFNDADASKADGRYWITSEYRPKTIAESFEDVYEAIDDARTAAVQASDTATDLDPLWAAIGEAYRDAARATTVGSLDTRVGTLDAYISQLNDDIYEPTTYSYQIGSPLPHSVAKMVDKLLILHNVSGGWGSDPTGVSHAGLPVASHTHAFTDIAPPPAIADTQARGGSHTTLENEVKRLRYEIQTTRGSSSWYSDIISPVTGSAESLSTHVNHSGSGAQTVSNPHGLDYTDIGVDTHLATIRSFTGMSAIGDSAPTYSSINYVTQGASLETAIGELDDALNTLIATTVIRADYTYDRSATSETDRENTPIIITHSMGRKPVIHVIDVSPQQVDYYGMYSSPTYDVEVNYPSDDQVYIWTGAAKIEVIAFF